MSIVPLPIIGDYQVQRFRQFSPEDVANWVMTQAPSGKKQMALYPTLGRSHVNYQGLNRLAFPLEPRGLFRTANYWYVVVGPDIFQVAADYTLVRITQTLPISPLNGEVYFTFIVAVSITYVVFTTGTGIYIFTEGNPASLVKVTDTNAPPFPTAVATFGNRIVCANANSTQFYLSKINLGGGLFDPTLCFTPATFNQATGLIKQFGVVNNTLYIFTTFTTDIWANIPSAVITSFSSGPANVFPWKQSSTYSFDFGISDPNSLDVDFNMMVWLAQNQNGLVQVMMSDGGKPKRLSNKAIDVLFQRYANAGQSNPFITAAADGFLYQYENTIYYRLSAGTYDGNQILDQEQTNNSIEYNFDTQTWSRVIEANGERNRIQKHVFFNNIHYVTVEGDSTVYDMSGQYYYNESTNPASTGPQDPNAYVMEPFRYERITPIISEDDYSEFKTEYVQIDFVWGDRSFINSTAPFENAVFIIDEAPSPVDGSPQFMVTETDPNTFIIQEGTNTPSLNEYNYNNLFKPHIELYWSDDGGINFNSADVREFSQLGVYSWRMRWYQLGCSRNRVYKLICVSPAPIVILGGVMELERVSGGAN